VCGAPYLVLRIAGLAFVLHQVSKYAPN
jgi:hypothetical protein